MDCAIGETVRTIAAALTPILVVLGWYWVDRRANRRESRKELRQITDRSIELVDDAVDQITKFHETSKPDDPTLEVEYWKVIRALNQIQGQIIVLKNSGFDVGAISVRMSDLKMVATGGDFMTKKWKPWDPSSENWKRLMYAAGKLAHALDREFFAKFPLPMTWKERVGWGGKS